MHDIKLDKGRYISLFKQRFGDLIQPTFMKEEVRAILKGDGVLVRDSYGLEVEMTSPFSYKIRTWPDSAGVDDEYIKYVRMASESIGK